MPRPIVEVLQSVARIQTTVTDPTQATVIVGPNYDVIDYDSSNADRSSSKIQGGYDPYGYGATTTTDFVVDISSRGTLDSESIEIHLENAYFEVGASASGCIASATNGNAASVATMETNKDVWQYKLVHTTGDFRDSNYLNGIQAGKTDLQLDFKMATEFRPSAASGFTDTDLGYLRSSDYYVKIDVADASVTDIPVYTFNDALSSSHTHIDLYEALDNGTGEVFSKLDNGVLLTVEGSECTLKIYDVNTNTVQATYTGTLHIPKQTTTVREIANDGSYVIVEDRLRQFVSRNLAETTQLACGRFEAELSRDFNYPDGISIQHLEDSDWAYDASSGSITFSNAITLQDTNLANASSLTDKVITRADLHIQSRGLITTDANTAKTVSSLTLSTLGEISSKNPLAQ